MVEQRERMGLIVPSGNSVMEPELYKMSPSGITIHTSRMYLEGRVAPDELAEMTKDAGRAAKSLSTIEPPIKVMIFGCTSGSFLNGIKWEKGIVEQLERMGKTRTITTARAVVEALGKIDARNIAVATPYTDELNTRLIKFIRDCNLNVASIQGLGLSKGGEIGSQTPKVTYDLAKRVFMRGHDIDTIFISCTNFRTIEIIEKLEKNLDVNVVTANQASFWYALKSVGFSRNIKGFGKLFLY